MSVGRLCIQCGRSLEGRRADAVFCRQRCQKRYARRSTPSNYLEPPLSGTAWEAEDRADERWHRQLAGHEEATAPLTPAERLLRDRARRNPGVMLPELQKLVLDRELERRRREAAETSQHQPLKVEDPYDRGSLGSVARRARYDRQLNKPADPHLRIMRPGPGRSGPPGYEENETLDKRDIGWG